MEKKAKNNIFIIIGGVIFVVIVAVFVVTRSKKSAPSAVKKEIIEKEVIIPTVDSSVKVDLKSINNKQEVDLTIADVPVGTQSVDYELSYQTQEQGLQGIIGTITISDISKPQIKRLTLGTCSSGKCVYHKLAGNIKTTLKFVGDYGEKLFEKEFVL